MKKTLSVLLASLLSFGISSLPVLAGTTPVTVNSTSNSPVGSGTNTSFRTITISSLPSAFTLSPADLNTSPPGQRLANSLQASGVDSVVAGNLIANLILALQPARDNGEISIAGDGTVSVNNSSLTVNEAAFNQAIANFNQILLSLEGSDEESNRKRNALLNNEIFVAISAFLRSR